MPTFLGIAALTAGALLGAAPCASAAPSSAPDWRDHLAIQLWAFNAAMKEVPPSPQPRIDVPAAFAAIRALGVRQVEMIEVPGQSARQLRAALDRAGLRAPSALFSYERVRDDLAGVIADTKALGAEQFGISAIKIFGPQGYHLLTIADADEAGAVLAKACAAAQSAGLRVFLHTHGNDLRPLDGESALDRMIDRAGGCFDLEADIYWIRSTGADPVAFIDRYGRKVTSIHLKDWRPPVGTRLPFPPLGQGELDLRGVMAAAKRAGARHYVIEDESGTPMRALSMSLDYLQRLDRQGVPARKRTR